MNVEPDGGGNLSHETRHPSLSPEPSPDQATEWTLEANEGLVFADNECVAELGLSDLVALPEEEDDNDFYAQTRRGAQARPFHLFLLVAGFSFTWIY